MAGILMYIKIKHVVVSSSSWFCLAAVLQGLHRSLAQLLSRAPSASPAYLSTETRITTFHRMFSTPTSLASMAADNEALTSSKQLCQAVATLLGGPGCRVAEGQTLSHADLVNLLYRNHTRYTRGKTAALEIPKGRANQLRLNKYHVGRVVAFVFCGHLTFDICATTTHCLQYKFGIGLE